MSEQKTALITGSSSGIGFAVSKELASRGYKVYSCARRLEPMEELRQYGVIPFVCDVTSLESVLAAKKFITEETGGKLDILYNNAGQACTFPCLDVTDEATAQCFEVNVFGPVRMTREFAPLLIKAKGCVAFTGSIAGMVPFPFGSIYGATKAAIHQYAAVLRIELKPFGVRVLNVVTGGVKTEIADTRPLPETSLYYFPEMLAGLVARRQMAAKNNPMPAEVYAKKVVNDMIYGGNVLNVYRGTMASLLTYCVDWMPRSLLEYLIMSKFQMLEAFKILKEKYSKPHQD